MTEEASPVPEPEPTENLVVAGQETQWLLASKSVAHVAVKRAMPNITILVHGVNDVGEAFARQEQGICAGLNTRLFRNDLVPGEWTLPPEKKVGTYTDADVHPDPDKVYFQRKANTGSSPIIPFFWGFREETTFADRSQRHGQYLDRFGNRLDKRYGKNGGPFANATTNLPDMFGPGFKRNLGVKIVDPEDATHALLSAPPRTYMVLAAQRLATLLRIIRKKSPNDTINIVAHSQGCFITLLAHAILAKGADGVKADTVIMNNPPYSLNEPTLEKFQTGLDQQTAEARHETLRMIVAEYITDSPVKLPAFAELKSIGDGVVGRDWQYDRRKERDNRGKLYLYFSPDDVTVGLPNIQGIGWWGVHEEMRVQLGKGFYQRLFASPFGANPKAPNVGTAPHEIRISFLRNKGFTWPRTRLINGEPLETLFKPDFGNAVLPRGVIDAAIATANTYKKDGQEGVLSNESPAQAQARWLNSSGKNSFHSSIVSNPMHSEKATAYDLSIGANSIFFENHGAWIAFLSAIADWRTNWNLSQSRSGSDKNDPSFPAVSSQLINMLRSEIDNEARLTIIANFEYHSTSGLSPGKLPNLTQSLELESLAPFVVSETMRTLRKSETSDFN